MAVMFGALLLAAHAAQVTAGEKSVGLFATAATLPLTITAPWREFARNKTAKASYPGTLEYIDESGAKHAVPLLVAPRGHNRLKVCKFAPIKLVFDKEAVRDTPFRGSKSLKLVTRCADDEQSEQYIVKEMLAYRIYNLVTERSFRARPLAVTYVDSAEGSSDSPHFAYLLEDDSELARRNNLEKIEVTTLPMAQLDPLEASRVSLFEYLIGNTDFALLVGSRVNTAATTPYCSARTGPQRRSPYPTTLIRPGSLMRATQCPARSSGLKATASAYSGASAPRTRLCRPRVANCCVWNRRYWKSCAQKNA